MTRTQQRTQAKPAPAQAVKQPQVTWQQKGCGMASTPNEARLHRAYFETFRTMQLEVYRLKLAGKRAEAAEKAAAYQQQLAHAASCFCGCGQKVVF